MIKYVFICVLAICITSCGPSVVDRYTEVVWDGKITNIQHIPEWGEDSRVLTIDDGRQIVCSLHNSKGVRVGRKVGYEHTVFVNDDSTKSEFYDLKIERCRWCMFCDE